MAEKAKLESSPAPLVGELYPPLRLLWPNLGSVSTPQAAFLLLDCLEAFYGGAAGGGKSDALLASALAFADKPGYAALILRRSFTDLALPGAIMDRSHQWLTGKAKWSHERKTWTFPGGATLTFGFLETDRDVYRYQSSEYQYIGFDELTQFSEAQYSYMFSRLRRTEKLQVPLRMRSASNPGGIGHGWVKKRFISERKPDAVFIPARVRDNPGLAVEEYTDSLRQLSPVLQQQLLDGDWGVFEGAAFLDFNPDVHCVPEFEIPDSWQRFESLDFGINNPTAWLAYAVDFDGNIVVYDEYYGKGIVSLHAAEITKRRSLFYHVVPSDDPLAKVPAMERPLWEWSSWGRTQETAPSLPWVACYADPSVRNRTGGMTKLGEPASVLTEFSDNGIGLTPGNNNPVAGYTRIRELMAIEPGRFPPPYAPNLKDHTLAPRLFIVGDRCPNLVEQLRAAPILPGDSSRRHAGEIVHPDWESAHGHAVASLRYGLMSRPSASEHPANQGPTTPEEERAAFLREADRREYEQEYA